MLVILTTHPIQYQTPLWQRLAASGRVDFEVWFMSDHAARPSLDREFGRVFAWDLDLLSGYPHRFVRAPRRELRSARATALLVNGWQTPAYWTAVWEGHRAGIPVMLRGESNDLHRTPIWKRGIKRLALTQLFARVDHFLTIGSANRRLYENYGISGDRLHATPYAVDNERFAIQAAALAPTRDAIRAGWGIPPDAYCILFAGKLIPKKRPHDIVAAFPLLAARAAAPPDARTRPLHLLFAGDGQLRESLRKECAVRFDVDRQPVDGIGLRERPPASFTGFLNQSEISKAYVAADCLVLPSDFRETWGLVVNEAMASGLPCVVSDACGCAEDVVAPVDKSLVFREGSPADLARAIAHLMTQPRSSERISGQIEKFSFDRTVDTIAELVNRS